jgi:metal-responsive CopG/Arc/MetJ family transcriptional regulator
MPRPKKQAAKAAKAPERVPVTLTMSRELLEQIDDLAQREERTRSRTVEIGMRQYVQAHGAKAAA